MNFKKLFTYKSVVLLTGFIIFFAACDPYKEPYTLPAYHAKAIIVGEENCSVDRNYNYWLLDLSIENNSSEKGDTIVYNSITYNHIFKALDLDTSLRHSGKKAEFDFNFSTNDHQKNQSSNCDAPNAQSFLLSDIYLFNQSEIQ